MNENNTEQIIRCSYCLESNPITETVCKKCGKSLREVSQDNLTDNQPKDNDLVDFDGDISNTITGLLLLGIGTGIAWIPIIQYLGFFLNFIGVILIFLNRHNFESKHGTYVILSIVIYVVSFIIAFTVTLAGVFSIATSSFSSLSLSQQQSLFRNEMQTIIIATIIAGMIGSISYFTITYGLQDEKGKLLLVVGLVSYFVVEAIIGILLYGLMTSLINNASTNGSFHNSGLSSFSSDIPIYSLFVVIPMVIYAFAYLRIRSIIQKEVNEGGSVA